MSVEETTQLIQLILNSVLMVLACAFVLGGLLLRRSVLENRLQIASVEYFQASNRFGEVSPRRLKLLKNQLHSLQQQVKISQNGILTMYYALMLFVSSTLLLSLRLVFAANWLLSLSIAVFISGIAILLLSVAIVLVDFHRSDRSFWQQVGDVVANPNLKRGSLKLRSNAVVRAPRRMRVS